MNNKVNDNKFYRTKLKLSAILLTLIVSLLAISLILNHLTRLEDNDTVLTINGEPVSMDEFLNIRSGLRANTYSYFSQKYGARDSINFWTTSFNGEVPADILRQNTIDELKRIKTEQILMKIHGIIDDISYSGFLKELNKENGRRKMAVMKNKPIYGPLQYDAKRFYVYLQSERIDKLKQMLSGKELLISEEEIRIYYCENKGGKYKRPDYIKIEKISLPVTNGYEDDSTIEKVKPEIVISQIIRNIRSGEKFEIIVNDYKRKGVKDIEFEELVFDGSTLRIYTTLYPELSTKVNDLKTNQISDIIREKNSLNIIKIIQKESADFMTLEEVRGHIKKELINNKYDIIINKLLDSAKVKLDEKILRKMSF